MIREIDMIVIHCTAHPDAAFHVGVREIRSDHIANRKWDDVGYHYIIRRNGEIEVGRMESVKGAHCPPVNARSIGVAWVGIEKPSSEQRSSLVRLTRELMLRYGLGVHRVFGHHEADPMCGKRCPVINMEEFRTECGQ